MNGTAIGFVFVILRAGNAIKLWEPFYRAQLVFSANDHTFCILF